MGHGGLKRMLNKFKIKIYSLLLIYSFSAKANERYILDNVQILTAENNFEVFLGHVVINNNIIETVNIDKYKNKKGDQKIIDCNIKFLLPGLIDTHTHTQAVPGMTSAQENDEKLKSIIQSYKKQLPKSYLYYGYTSILDLSLSNKSLAPEFDQKKELPQLLIGGGPLTEKNGYPLIFLENNHDFNIINSSDESYKNQIELALDKILANHGKVLKLYYETGFDKNKNLPNLSKNSYSYSVEQAHKRKIPVIIHANSLEAFKNTIHLKHDAYAHGLWRWNSDPKNLALLPNEVTNILDKIIDQKIAYQPTTQVVHGIYLLFDNNFLNRKEVANVIPKGLLDWLKIEDNQIIANEIRSTVTKKQAFQIFTNSQKTLNYIAKRNGFLIFGTDTPSAAIHTNLPGYNGYLEMLNWSHAGVTNKQILKAATINNAKFLKLDKSLGSIAANKTADLILLEKNPLEKIENINSIQKIILRGKIISRESLR